MAGVICGTGSYVPTRVLDNNDIAKMVDTNDEWIKERTGIERRHNSIYGCGSWKESIGRCGNDFDECGPDFGCNYFIECAHEMSSNLL